MSLACMPVSLSFADSCGWPASLSPCYARWDQVVTKKQYFLVLVGCVGARPWQRRREACIKAPSMRKRLCRPASRELQFVSGRAPPKKANKTRGHQMTERAQPTDLELAALISS